MDSNQDETPSWLTDSSPSAPAATPSSSASPAAAGFSSSSPAATASSGLASPTNNQANVDQPQNVSSGAGSDPASLQAMEAEQLRGVILFTRLLNLGVSIAVIVHAVLIFIRFTGSPKYWILGLYATCGGCLICCLETQLKFFRTLIAMNFGFLFSPFLRFLFYILMATVCLSFDDLFGNILAAALVAVALYNTFVLIKYPAYRKMRDELAKEEDKRIEARLREKMRKEATRQMFQK